MENQTELIERKDWDILLVLDACRFDYFKKYYQAYLRGNLTKATSPAKHTTEWILKTFRDGDYQDTVYISGNPYITSKKRKDIDGYHPRKYFKSVVDCWDYDFVYPSILNNTYKAIPKPNGYRYIIHYMQPHSPYVCDGVSKRPVFSKIVGRTIGIRNYNWIKKFTLDKLEKIAIDVNPYEIREAYLDNLLFVLSYVKEFIDKTNKRVVVTSDHGELLLEDNLYGHGDTLPDRCELSDVPWLVVK